MDTLFDPFMLFREAAKKKCFLVAQPQSQCPHSPWSLMDALFFLVGGGIFFELQKTVFLWLPLYKMVAQRNDAHAWTGNSIC